MNDLEEIEETIKKLRFWLYDNPEFKNSELDFSLTELWHKVREEIIKNDELGKNG